MSKWQFGSTDGTEFESNKIKKQDTKFKRTSYKGLIFGVILLVAAFLISSNSGMAYGSGNFFTTIITFILGIVGALYILLFFGRRLAHNDKKINDAKQNLKKVANKKK